MQKPLKRCCLCRKAKQLTKHIDICLYHGKHMIMKDRTSAIASANTLLSVTGGLAAPDPARIRAQYVLRASGAEAERIAEALCLEHTVELPRALIGEGYLSEYLTGSVEKLVAIDTEQTRCEIAYPADTGKGGLTTLLTLVMGNAGFFPEVQLVDIDLPESTSAGLSGPRHGIPGLRMRTGCAQGPLAGTALKPLGASVSELAKIAREMAEGGIHIVKEDDGLSMQPYAPFPERVRACADAVSEGAARSGSKCLYFPNITGPVEGLADRALHAQECGAGGVEILPGVMGFDAVRLLADLEAFDLPVAVHSAWTGGMCRAGAPALSNGFAFGVLPRLAGADISIMPGFEGRIGLPREDCRTIADVLKRPRDGFAPAMPMPGGGLTTDRIGQFVATYGEDMILLMSGALFEGPGSLIDNCRAYVAAARTHHDIS